MKRHTRSSNARCSICNSVSSVSIETNIGDYTPKNFVPDPKDNLFHICEECKEQHESLMHDYELRDFLNGLLEDDDLIPFIDDD